MFSHAERHDDTLTTQVRKNKRHGRIYLDTARNAYGQTVVPPYAVRAKPQAPVATPLHWDELLEGDVSAKTYRVSNILDRLDEQGDPWKDIKSRRQSLDTVRDAVEHAK